MNSLITRIENLNWRMFLVGLIMGALVTILIRSGSIQSIFSFFKPQEKAVVKENDIFNSIVPKLKEFKNTYNIKSPNNIISEVNAESLDIPVNAYLVLDFDTGEILEEKNSSKILPIASLTKIMTSVVALDLSDPNEIFTISKNAEDMIPTKIGVIEGEKMTLQELLNATLLTSANDAAQVIEEGIEEKYGDNIFEKAMNEKAKVLGLKNSSFSNPQGFDSRNNYSTAKDFAILTHYALTNYPLISEIVKKDYEFLAENENHKQFDLYNWNGLIDVYPNVYGVKIGRTGRAQSTTAVISEREGKKVLVVLLGAPGVLERDLWASQLLDVGFEKLANLPKIEVTEDMLLSKYQTWQYFN